MRIQSIYEQSTTNRKYRPIVHVKEEKVEDVGCEESDEVVDDESFKCEFPDYGCEGS